jgi:hypothetical protein
MNICKYCSTNRLLFVTLRKHITSPLQSPTGQCCLGKQSLFIRSYFTTDRQSVSTSCFEHPCGTCDQILLSVGMLLSEICGPVSMGRPLWREDGSAICSAIAQWSQSRRICNHTLLSLWEPFGTHKYSKYCSTNRLQFVTLRKHITSALQSPTG